VARIVGTLETSQSANGSTEASAVSAATRPMRTSVEILKVSATSKPVAVAGAIAGVVRTQSRVEVQAIGAGAINQAVKAIAISRGYVAAGGIDLVCIPSFIDISIDGEERTGIRLLVEAR
jgi:stage V sporulation protein S